MKRFTFFLFLLFSMTTNAQTAGNVAQLIKAKVKHFKEVTDTAKIPAEVIGYAVILGSSELDTNDFCFSISLFTDVVTLDRTFRNYYFTLEGSPVLLYLNHPSMLYLAEALGAQKITKDRLEQLRALFADFPFLLTYPPYQVCCNKDGVISGEIIFPAHERLTEIKPEGIPLKSRPSLSGYRKE